MSSSSNCGSRYKRVKCRCGVPAALLRSWTNDNPGRRFYKCKFSKPNSNLGCGYFQWGDKEQCEWQRNTINQLLLEKKVVNSELMMIKCENAHLLEQNRMLKEAIAMLRCLKVYEDVDGLIQENRKTKCKKTAAIWLILVVCLVVVLAAIVFKE